MTLRIKDSTSMKELEKRGFKKKHYHSTLCLVYGERLDDIVFNLKTRRLLYVNYSYDVLYDMIQDEILEKVSK